jgi:hypothetical protein
MGNALVNSSSKRAITLARKGTFPPQDAQKKGAKTRIMLISSMQSSPDGRTVERTSRAGGVAVAWFTISAGAVLLFTGVAKIISVFGVARLLQADTPILHVTYGHLMLGVGGAELLIAGLCFLPKTRKAGLASVAVLSTLFLVYRIGLWAIGWRGICGCMGDLTGEIGLTVETAEKIMKVLLAYLLCGSYASLAWRWTQGRRARLVKSAAARPAIASDNQFDNPTPV